MTFVRGSKRTIDSTKYLYHLRIYRATGQRADERSMSAAYLIRPLSLDIAKPPINPIAIQKHTTLLYNVSFTAPRAKSLSNHLQLDRTLLSNSRRHQRLLVPRLAHLRTDSTDPIQRRPPSNLHSISRGMVSSRLQRPVHAAGYEECCRVETFCCGGPGLGYFFGHQHL